MSIDYNYNLLLFALAFYKIITWSDGMNYDNVLADMGKRIFARRKELKMTQESLAEKVGLSFQSVSCIELGKKGVRPENLIKICNTLDVSADYLLFGKRDACEMSELSSKMSELSKEDYELVEKLVSRLNENKNKN